MKSVLQIHPSDNVLVALRDLKAGETIPSPDGELVLLEPCAAKHKVLFRDLDVGGIITQYGVTVGKANFPLKKGLRISTENAHHAADPVDVTGAGKFQWTAPDVSSFKNKTFQGFARPDGRVGTRNNWLVIPLVFCENNNLLTMREVFMRELGYNRTAPYELYLRRMIEAFKKGESVEKVAFEPPVGEVAEKLFPNIDGVRFLVHSMGCGGIEQDSLNLSRLIASYIVHPNTAGATIISLGCQKAQISVVQDALKAINPNHGRPLYFLEQQKTGTEEALLKEAIQLTFRGLVEADKHRRTPAPLSKLVIGVECGGSDGVAGLSANPTVGRVSDLLVALGGSSILSEFPELIGVESELVKRSASPAVAEKFVGLMRDYEAAARSCGASMDCNPSPGNIRDGLITDAIKSAGAAKKGGTSPIVDVQDYPGWIDKPGLNLLNTPGNDVESTTALAGAGANLILFTTGLGTPTGNPITPVVKISSNSRVASYMHDVIDFDTGAIIEGRETPDSLGEKLLEQLIRTASGELTKAELLGQDDFIPWKRGVSL